MVSGDAAIPTTGRGGLARRVRGNSRRGVETVGPRLSTDWPGAFSCHLFKAKRQSSLGDRLIKIDAGKGGDGGGDLGLGGFDVVADAEGGNIGAEGGDPDEFGADGGGAVVGPVAAEAAAVIGG